MAPPKVESVKALNKQPCNMFRRSISTRELAGTGSDSMTSSLVDREVGLLLVEKPTVRFGDCKSSTRIELSLIMKLGVMYDGLS